MTWSLREAMLKLQYADLYPGLEPGIWMSAATLAEHILAIHTKLTDLIELRDAAAARALMDDHVKMIRARRVAEHGQAPEEGHACC